MEIARVRIINLETVVAKYFEYKKEESKFKKFLDKQAERIAKDGTSNSVHNKEQQKVSESG